MDIIARCAICGNPILEHTDWEFVYEIGKLCEDCHMEEENDDQD